MSHFALPVNDTEELSTLATTVPKVCLGGGIVVSHKIVFCAQEQATGMQQTCVQGFF